MKKLILLNGALLLVLFSIKFSPENLNDHLRAFRGEGEIVLQEETPQPAPVEIPPEASVQEEIVDKISLEDLPVASFQEVSPPVFRPDAKIEPKENESSFFYPKRILLSHTEGYGNHEKQYRTNYSLAEIVFAPSAKEGVALPLLDLRGYRFDNGKYAISAGLAVRYIPEEANQICNLLGVNLYYDSAPDTPGYHQQIGAGVEILGKRLDFRANIYAPFGDRDDAGICCSRYRVNGWLSSGFNLEVGYLLYQTKSFFLYSAVGPYYVTACKCQERQRGIMLRVFPQYKDFVGLNLKYSYDPLFNAVFQAELIISMPFYQLSGIKKTSCGITNRQIYQRIERR